MPSPSREQIVKVLDQIIIILDIIRDWCARPDHKTEVSEVEEEFE